MAHTTDRVPEDIVAHLRAEDARVRRLTRRLTLLPVLVGALVVAVGRAGATPGQALQPYREALAGRQLALPVFAADVRRKTDVLLLIETLIANAEVNAWT